MKKIAIVTLNGTANYGNRLQNYALQKILEDEGYEADTLVLDFPETESRAEKLRRLIKLVMQETITSFIGKVQQQIFERKYPQMKADRKAVFSAFTEKYIHVRVTAEGNEEALKQLGKEYDFYIAGSDQVWRPAYIANNKYWMEFYFLTFTEPAKRIAYAASFGISSLPSEIISLYSPYLENFYKISVREAAGQQILKENFQKESELVVDPTMLLSRRQWLEIAEDVPGKPDRYMLVYFLGQLKGKLKKELEDFAVKHNLQIVNLAKTKNNTAYISGPAEFIDYIRHAALVCTDSFHGTVFSIIMHTPFLAYERSYSEMMSRIDTLLNTFGMQERKVKSIYDIDNPQKCNFNETDTGLERERKKAMEFLNAALSHDILC